MQALSPHCPGQDEDVVWKLIVHIDVCCEILCSKNKISPLVLFLRFVLVEDELQIQNGSVIVTVLCAFVVFDVGNFIMNL